tara:strand:- start:180485 stop:181693 length:1209 start_codon:yes stop_codon:yes gene_type:complete
MESLSHGSESKPKQAPPRRMVCVGNEFGMYPGAFWPETFGRDYKMPPALQPLAPHRNDFTIFSHLDHGLKGGHFAIHAFLSGVKASDASGMPDGGISLDQRAAEHVGSRTRFPSLTIGSESGIHGGCRMSWTRTGTRIPPIEGPRELFRQLFREDDPKQRRKRADRVELQSSILDAVLGDAKSLERKLNPTDAAKLDEYLSAVREVEVKLDLDRHWQSIGKPDAPMEEPRDEGLTHDLPKIYDLIALALQTDSTRVATVEIGNSFAVSDLGIRKGYHSLSHHGQVQDNIDLLVQIERYQVEQFSRFVGKLKSIKQPGTDLTLLDSTMALFGSGMGNANSHTNSDLPIVLAGGGFRHGEHLEMPKDKRVPLSNLFVSMLQQFGVETDRFAQSTGTLTGLDVIS